MQKIKLTDLIDISVLQRIQDGFSTFTGMAALTTDENGVPVTEGSGFTDFCTNYIRQSELGLKRCKECDKMGAVEVARTGCASTYFCHAGLIDYSAPIMVEGNIIGSFIGGQVRTDKIDKDKCKAMAEELGLEPSGCIMAAKQTQRLEKETIDRAARFLVEIAKVLSEMAYQNYLALQKSKRMERAARSQAAYIMNMTANLEEDMEAWKPLAEKGIASGDVDIMRDVLHKLQNISKEALSDVRDVFEYIHLSAGEAMLSEAEYNINDVIQQIKDGVMDECEEYQTALKIEIAEGTPSQFMGDSGRIVILFTKILQMFLKHVEESVTLKISSKRNSYSTWLVFRMEDFILDVPTANVIQEVSKSRQAIYGEEEDEEELKVEQLLVKQMNGTIHVSYENPASMYFEICLPQLAIRGEDNGV